MSSSDIRHVTDDTFDPEVLKSDTPVLVDYWADWCGPCKSIAPILDEVAREYEGRLKVAKINVDQNQVTPAKFAVRGADAVQERRPGSDPRRRPFEVAAHRVS
jgi:thioredoxin 1